MFLIEQMKTAIMLKPKKNGTDVTFETQFELVGVWKFADGFFARMGVKQVESNLNTAKQILEAG
jgi:hypothetical protein